MTRVIARLELGGAQLGALRISRALERRAVRHRVLAASADAAALEHFAAAGFEVEVFGAAADAQYRLDHDFAAWLRPRLEDAELVHAHMLGAWWAAARAASSGVPLVASEHNSVRWSSPPAEFEPQARAALNRVDRFLAHGPDAREFALARGVPADRLAAGVSVIDPSVPEPDRALPRRRVVYAGRLHPEKGPDLLLRALALLDPAPPAFILGAGAMEGELRALASRLGLDGAVRFCGWQDEPGRWLRRASACVVPSRHEAWSQTAVHAMALGTPVVATAVEGLPDTLAGGRGILVEPESPAALADALTGVLARRAMPDLAAARRYAVAFTPDTVADRYESIYRALVDHRRLRALGGRGNRAPARRLLGAAPA